MIDKITLPNDPLSLDNSSPTELRPAKIKDYIAIARPDNWIKNLFMVPGMLFALSVFHTPFNSQLILKIVLGLISICLVASANYVINEYLDAGFDKYHPLKNKRSSVVF